MDWFEFFMVFVIELQHSSSVFIYFIYDCSKKPIQIFKYRILTYIQDCTVECIVPYIWKKITKSVLWVKISRISHSSQKKEFECFQW